MQVIYTFYIYDDYKFGKSCIHVEHISTYENNSE